MKLYLIRHGESENNRSLRWTGWMDVLLTEKGEEDARRAGALLANTAFDKVYASDLRRAMRTAEIALPGCSYETTSLLREINVGALENTPIHSEVFKQREHVARNGYGDIGGESRAEFAERVQQFMTQLETCGCETVAAFSHGGWLRQMLDTVVGMAIPRDRLCCNNCTIAVFEFTKGIWRLHSWINLV